MEVFNILVCLCNDIIHITHIVVHSTYVCSCTRSTAFVCLLSSFCSHPYFVPTPSSSPPPSPSSLHRSRWWRGSCHTQRLRQSLSCCPSLSGTTLLCPTEKGAHRSFTTFSPNGEQDGLTLQQHAITVLLAVVLCLGGWVLST